MGENCVAGRFHNGDRSVIDFKELQENTDALFIMCFCYALLGVALILLSGVL
jgi:hypothetical protein